MKITTCALLAALFAASLAARPVQAQGVRQGVEDLGNKLIQNVPKDKRIVVVVSDFPNLQGETCELGRYIAARLTTKLSRAPGIQVRERSRLNQVINELAFNMEGLVDPSKAKQVGKLLGADALVLGEISDLGTIVEIDARIVELETGNSLPGAFTAISKDSVVENLLSKGCVAPEGQVAAASPRPQDVSIKKSKPTSTAKPYFENKFLRTTVTSLTHADRNLVIAVRIENTTETSIDLVHVRNNRRSMASVIGSNGVACITEGVVRGISSDWANQLKKKIPTLQTFYPRTPVILSYKMYCDRGATSADYSYNAEFFGIVAGQETRFNVSIARITAKE